MAKKYIRIVELAQVTGRPYNEILSLVNTGGCLDIRLTGDDG